MVFEVGSLYLKVKVVHEASCKYGSNTKWCITGTKRWHTDSDGSKTWKEYEDAGIKMYFFINRKDNEKYALAVYPNTEKIGKVYEIFNEEDLEIPYIPNAPIIKEIGVEYWNKRNDRDLIKLLLMQNKLPEDLTMITLTEVLNQAINPFADDYITDSIVTNDIDEIIDILDNSIPDGYIEHENLNPEDYERITGEEWEEDWDGDVPVLSYSTYDKIVNNCKTKSEICSKNNPFISNNKYWLDIFTEDEEDIIGVESYEKLIRDGIYFNFDREITFDEFLDKCVETLLDITKDNTKWDNQLTRLGINKEFLRNGK